MRVPSLFALYSGGKWFVSSRIPGVSALLAVLLLISLHASSQRQQVLKQIDVPHDYYYREMYLPQLTSGPGAAAWSPDGKQLVFSMAGSLWVQNVGDTAATQLTNGPGYDYQPDWSPDGMQIVFTKYINDALELHLFNIQTKAVTALTSEGNVNAEPRFSPDGKRLAFVSTKNTGHFRIWIADISNGKITGSEPLSRERKTETPRYYYSQFDHQLSPSWSPDGQSIMMVSNPDNIYGTGSIYKVKLNAEYDPVLIQKEETTWKTRPDWCRDGKRVVYTSYLGRQWHQLWVTTAAENGNPYPLGYGNYDVTYPRWSPDGSKIAYTSNEEGNTSLWIFDVSKSTNRPLRTLKRIYLTPMSQLTIATSIGNRPATARLTISDEKGRSYFPDDAWAHADDGFDRAKQKFETHYFHANRIETISVPQGKVRIKAYRGLEYNIIDTTITMNGAHREIKLAFTKLSLPENWSNTWVSGDVHVHMNYGGHYRNVPFRLVQQCEAEDLDVVFNTIVNKEQRVIDYNYFIPYPDPASNSNVLLSHGQEYHSSYWGHLGLLGLNDRFLLPGYSSYPNTAIASPYPSNSVVADLAHEQNALVGYVHPFYDPPDPAKDDITHELPIDVALGKVDYYEVVGFSWHKESASVWYRLLNCGFKLTAAGGTDAMANYASLRGPVGMNRVYVNIDQPAGEQDELLSQWLSNFKQGKTLATNAPILGFEVNNQKPGSEIKLSGKKKKVSFKGFLRSIVPMDHLEIVLNGKVIKSFDLKNNGRSMDISGNLTIDGSSWLLLRAWNDNATPDIYDIYPYGTTNPVFISVNDQPVRSAADADYFIRWIDKVKESASTHTGYLNEDEKKKILDDIATARKVFEGRK